MDNCTGIEALKLKRMRVRNEISFLRSETACGGPERKDELATLREELSYITLEIDCLQNQ